MPAMSPTSNSQRCTPLSCRHSWQARNCRCRRLRARRCPTAIAAPDEAQSGPIRQVVEGGTRSALAPVVADDFRRGSTSRCLAAGNAADHVTTVMQRTDDLRQCCDGLRAVAATVMHEHNAARPYARPGGCLNDLGRTGPAPIQGVDGPQNLTQPLLSDDAPDAWIGGAVRRPHASALRTAG